MVCFSRDGRLFERGAYSKILPLGFGAYSRGVLIQGGRSFEALRYLNRSENTSSVRVRLKKMK